MFNQTCRTCMATCGELVPIFSNDSYVRNLPKKLQQTINIEVLIDDDLPKVMCKKCIFLVDSLYCFKHQCEVAEIKLKKKLKNFTESNDYDVCTSIKAGNLSDTVISSEEEYHIEYASEEAKLEVENARKRRKKAKKKLTGIKVKSVEILGDTDSNVNKKHKKYVELKEDLNDTDSDDRSSLHVSDGSKMYISESLLRNKSKSPSNTNISTVKNRSATLKSGSKRKLDGGYSGTSKESKKVMFNDYNCKSTVEDQTLTSLENLQHQEEDLSDSTLKTNLTDKKTERVIESCDSNLNKKVLINKTSVTSAATTSNLVEKKMEDLIKYSVVNIPPICALCSESFESYIDVLKHKIKIHLSKGQNQFFCPICYEKFHGNNDLCEHLDEHSGVYSFVCLLCSGNYYNLETLRNHLQSHVDLSEMVCLICAVHLPETSEFMKHLEFHINNKKSVCTLCTNTYNSREKFQNHVDQDHRRLQISQENQNEDYSIAHNEAQRQFSCLVCDKKFSSHKSRTQHMEEHMKPSQKKDVKKFRCRVCKEIIVSQAAYVEHLKKEHCNSKETNAILKEISESSMNEQANVPTSSLQE